VSEDDLLLTGKTVVVTAGPTREPIDPVRFITNRSSGKMGYAIAAAALEQGARVVLISGPTSISTPDGADVHRVETAQEMYDLTHAHISEADIFIATAAVSDYRPVEVQAQKIKKNDTTMQIDLVRSEDILASVAALEGAPFTVGFAAETENVREYALGKLQRKKLDMIVANQVGGGKGFDSDQNAVNVYWQAGEQSFGTAEKTELARDVLKLIAERYEIEYSAGEYAIN
jgi:phosphopantothenoylcysteine decarboxylase/phosphopantothenate--cysteine ligase